MSAFDLLLSNVRVATMCERTDAALTPIDAIGIRGGAIAWLGTSASTRFVYTPASA